jgi:hypothetical protein
MTPHDTNLQRALERIYTADMLDLHCDAAGTLMARCIDAGLSKADAQQRYPDLSRHFAVCIDCSAEYTITQDLSNVTAADQADIPVPPRPDRATLFSRLREAINIPFSGFAPQAQVALSRGADLDVEPVLVEIDSADLTVELDVGINETDATTRDLYCNIISDSVETEGLTITLSADASKFQDEQAFNDMGDVIFEQLDPEQAYTLWFKITAQSYEISGVVLP